MKNKKRKFTYNFQHWDRHPAAFPEQLPAARLEGFQHGYTAAVRLNLHTPEPWSDENRERNQMYIKGVIEGQDRLRAFQGLSVSPNNLSLGDPRWEDAALLGEYMVGYMHGFDSGCVACFCTVDPDDEEDNGTTPAFSYMD